MHKINHHFIEAVGLRVFKISDIPACVKPEYFKNSVGYKYIEKCIQIERL